MRPWINLAWTIDFLASPCCLDWGNSRPSPDHVWTTQPVHMSDRYHQLNWYRVAQLSATSVTVKLCERKITAQLLCKSQEVPPTLARSLQFPQWRTLVSHWAVHSYDTAAGRDGWSTCDCVAATSPSRLSRCRTAADHCSLWNTTQQLQVS